MYNRHYCYRIDFADGFVYIGVRTCRCLIAHDSYMGSPVAHAAKWLTDIPRVKTIVSVHATRELAEIAEAKLIDAFWVVSKPLSLNASINGTKFHVVGRTYKHTAEARAKMSAAQKGKKRGRYSDKHRLQISRSLTGKKRKPFTANACRNMSIAQTGKRRGASHCAKIVSSKWYTDGVANKRLLPDANVPEGFRPGRSSKDGGAAQSERAKIQLTCPHCSKTGNRANMKHWHFDNCLERPDNKGLTRKQIKEQSRGS